jgi:flavorubredoxin
MEYGAKVAGKVTGKLVAAFTSGAGSSNSVLLSLERNDRSLQIEAFRMEKACNGIVSKGTPNAKDLEACRKLGEALAKAAINEGIEGSEK